MHFNTCIAGASIESMFHLHILPHVWRGSTDVRHEKKSLRLKGQMRCIFLLQRFRPPVLKFLVLGFPWIKFVWRVFFELWSSVVPPLILCPYGQCISWKFMFFSRAMHFEEITSVFFSLLPNSFLEIIVFFSWGFPSMMTAGLIIGRGRSAHGAIMVVRGSSDALAGRWLAPSWAVWSSCAAVNSSWYKNDVQAIRNSVKLWFHTWFTRNVVDKCKTPALGQVIYEAWISFLQISVKHSAVKQVRRVCACKNSWQSMCHYNLQA